jgi:putative YhdH/YhfP family quinone oxidoreductase
MTFRASVTHHTAHEFAIGIEELTFDDLPPGDVLIQVAYAAMNYKDALVCSANGRIAQVSPLVPGLELTGTIVESNDPRFPPGSAVLASDFGRTMGIAHHGGFSEYARVPSEWLSLLPPALGFKSACLLSGMLPAALALHHLERHGLAPDSGPVLVTGATGGVGSLAIRLLAQRGYTVAASTGKLHEKALLQQLGAKEILSREEVSAPSERPLEPERWAGGIDSVGGATLAYLMRTTMKAGAIAALGVAGGAAYQATVYPLILRGIQVLGIDCPSCPQELRRELWEEVSADPALLPSEELLTSEITLEDLPRVATDMLNGRTKGRVLVRPA